MHEYKPEKRRDNDPLGQLLAAMLVAQKLNKEEFPLYGCYVNGRNWFFGVLEGKNYAVSPAYDATQDDIFQVFSILKEAKVYIEQRVATLN